MEDSFKEYLLAKGVTTVKYNDGSLDAQAKLVEAFENSKKSHAPTGKVDSHLLDILKSRLANMDTSPPVVVLSPKGGMKGQTTQPFGQTLYGITETAKAVAKLADKTFENFALKKIQPNKTEYVMGALLSGAGTGKSAFEDIHASLLLKHCQNEDLKNLMNPESHPLILNVTFNSGTDYSVKEGTDSGVVAIARRLVYAYTDGPWDLLLNARTEGIVSIRSVLELIVSHHRRVCGMAEDQPMVVVVNVDELNQIHSRLSSPDKRNAADERVREVVIALRLLSMAGVTGIVGDGPTVLCLLAGTGNVTFRRSLEGSGVEYIAQSLPLLNGAEIIALMKECQVHEKYLTDPSFQQLLEDTGGVPRILRKVLEGLTLEYAEYSIAEARMNALQYVESSHLSLSAEEKMALVPFVVLGDPAPPMPTSLVKRSPNSHTFEDLRMSGAIFQVNGQLLMPVLLLQSLFPSDSASLISRLVYWYHQRSWDGFEMFCALFHSLKMQHLSKQSVREVSMEDFYRGALMPAEVAAMKMKLKRSVKYEVHGQPSDVGTYRFPGEDEAKNKLSVGLLKNGSILLNGKRAPAGDVLLANPMSGRERGMLVLSLCMAHTAKDLTLNPTKIAEDNSKATEVFKRHSELFAELGATQVLSVHVSNRALNNKIDQPPDGCVVIGRDQMPKFFGPTFQRGLMSPTYAAALRAADSPRAYCTAGDSQRKCPSRSPRPVPAHPSCTVAGLRLVRNLARRLL